MTIHQWRHLIGQPPRALQNVFISAACVPALPQYAPQDDEEASLLLFVFNTRFLSSPHLPPLPSNYLSSLHVPPIRLPTVSLSSLTQWSALFALSQLMKTSITCTCDMNSCSSRRVPCFYLEILHVSYRLFNHHNNVGVVSD